MAEGGRDSPCQCVAFIPPGGEFTVPSTSNIRLDRFSLLDDHPAGERLTVMAHVTSPTGDQRTAQMDVAIASFIIGQDYDQSSDILISPVDTCVLTCLGPHIPVQLLYSVLQ
jgi:hypothetical protein